MYKLYVVLLISLILTLIQEWKQLFRVIRSFILNSFIIGICIIFWIYTQEIFEFLEYYG